MKRKKSPSGPRPSPRDVTLSEILLAALERADPGPEATQLQRTRFLLHETLTRALMEFWGPRTVAQMTPSAAQEYRTWRSGLGRRRHRDPSTRPLADRTITSQLSFLAAQTVKYAKEHELNWPKPDLGSLQHGKAKPLMALTRSDITRLMWGARGATYSPDAAQGIGRARGVKPSCFRPAQDEVVPGTRKRSRKHLLRLFLIAYYSGSTAHCVARLRWQGDPEGEHSFVDVEAGLLYRLGPDAAPGKAAGMPVPISGRLLVHLRRWARIDAESGHETVVQRQGRRTPALAPPSVAFRAVRDDAGFADKAVQMSMLQHATGAELMRKDVTIRSAAIFMGLDPKTVEARYNKSRDDFHEGARTALECPPRSIESMPAMSLAWRAMQIKQGDRQSG